MSQALVLHIAQLGAWNMLNALRSSSPCPGCNPQHLGAAANEQPWLRLQGSCAPCGVVMPIPLFTELPGLSCNELIWRHSQFAAAPVHLC